ncbi:MAG TPA: holin [Clostridia bacterium]|nr:holin [Clostridia bacterium]
MKIAKLTKDWLWAALARAIKTTAQTALGLFTVGSAFTEIDWIYIISVAGVAGIYSLLTSVATGLPEVTTDGELLVDVTNPKKEIYLLDLSKTPEDIKARKYIRLKVDTTAELESQQ